MTPPYRTACHEIDMMVKMIDSGMDVARINFGQGDLRFHSESLDNIRLAAKQRPEKPVTVMLDTAGPRIMTGTMKDGKNVEVQNGSILQITTDMNVEGDAEKISCSYKQLP